MLDLAEQRAVRSINPEFASSRQGASMTRVASPEWSALDSTQRQSLQQRQKCSIRQAKLQKFFL